jgi:hypothetical protein
MRTSLHPVVISPRLRSLTVAPRAVERPALNATIGVFPGLATHVDTGRHEDEDSGTGVAAMNFWREFSPSPGGTP